ncbi:MAG: hypothetical protein KC425_19405 [Anaerolineales bacterium]|nr:hypothetical protein [Anaerolineales bacterium]
MLKQSNTQTVLAALGADAVALAGLLWIGPALAARLERPSGVHALWLVGVYVLFMAAVFVLRKRLPPVADAASGWWRFWLDRRTRTGLALLFGLAMMSALAYQLGYFDVFLTVGPENVNEGESSALFVFGPSAWLFLSLFYVLILAFPVRGGETAVSPVLLLPLLLAINGMALFGSALLAALLPEGVYLWLLPLFGLLWLLFAPPRLLLAASAGGWRSLLSLVVWLAACAWLAVG